MMPVDDGRIGLDDEIRTWLPELASPDVVRTPSSPVDDVVAAHLRRHSGRAGGARRGTAVRRHVVPSTGTVTVLFGQVAMTGPTPPALMRELWTCAAG